MTQVLAVAWKPAAVIVIMGLLTFFPDLQGGKTLQASLVDGGYAAVKVAAALFLPAGGVALFQQQVMPRLRARRPVPPPA